MRVAPIVLCGGVGRRLFPFSSCNLPKQFIIFFKDGESFFQKTIRRIRKIFPTQQIIIVANKINQNLVKQQLKDIGEGNVLVLFECYNKNTFLSLVVAMMVIDDDCDLISVFPSDHFILDEKNFRQDVLSALEISTQKKKHILFGIKPTKPDDNYGYIQIGENEYVDGMGNIFFKIKSFIEKPSKGVAKTKIQSDRYYWNSGIFVFNNKQLTKDVVYQNKISGIKENIFIKKDDIFLESVAKNLPELPEISIDEAIIENNKELLCKKAQFDWKDIGNFTSLHELMEKKYIIFSILAYITQCDKYSINS